MVGVRRELGVQDPGELAYMVLVRLWSVTIGGYVWRWNPSIVVGDCGRCAGSAHLHESESEGWPGEDR